MLRLLHNRSQMASNRGKSKNVAHPENTKQRESPITEVSVDLIQVSQVLTLCNV